MVAFSCSHRIYTNCIFLAVCVIARQFSRQGGLRVPISFVGETLSLDLYHSLMNVRNQISACTLADVIANFDLHFVPEDESEDMFF